MCTTCVHVYNLCTCVQHSWHVYYTFHICTTQCTCVPHSSHVYHNTVNMCTTQCTCIQHSSHVYNIVHMCTTQFICVQYSSHMHNTVYMCTTKYTYIYVCVLHSVHIQGRVHGGGSGGGTPPPRSNFGGGYYPPLPLPSFSINSLAKQTALKLNPIQDPKKFNSFKINKWN